MSLTNTQLLYFDAHKLHLDGKKRAERHSQVHNLISRLNAGLNERNHIVVRTAIKTGIVRETHYPPEGCRKENRC